MKNVIEKSLQDVIDQDHQSIHEKDNYYKITTRCDDIAYNNHNYTIIRCINNESDYNDKTIIPLTSYNLDTCNDFNSITDTTLLNDIFNNHDNINTTIDIDKTSDMLQNISGEIELNNQSSPQSSPQSSDKSNDSNISVIKTQTTTNIPKRRKVDIQLVRPGNSYLRQQNNDNINTNTTIDKASDELNNQSSDESNDSNISVIKTQTTTNIQKRRKVDIQLVRRRYKN